MPGRLQGQLILNTRPVHQQAELTTLLEQESAQVLSFPVIEIAFPESSDADKLLGQQISHYDIL